MRERLNQMKMKDKLNFGYSIVIIMMVVLGILSMVGLAVLYGNFNSYISGVQKADTAVKMCRIDVNVAARLVREAETCLSRLSETTAWPCLLLLFA